MTDGSSYRFIFIIHLHISAFLQTGILVSLAGTLVIHLSRSDKESGMQKVNRCPTYIMFFSSIVRCAMRPRVPECEMTAKLAEREKLEVLLRWLCDIKPRHE